LKQYKFSGGEMKKIASFAMTVLMAAAAWAQTGVSLPPGTSLQMKLENNLSTSSKTGENFSARVVEPVMLDGKQVIPIGATVMGHVTNAVAPRRIHGKPTIDIYPESLVMPNGDKYVLNAVLVDTSEHRRSSVNNEGEFKGAGIDGKDVTQMGMATGAGMLIGGLAGGGKGVLIGGAIGATAIVTKWLATHRSATLPAGSELTMELSHTLAMNATGTGGN
jgi:hypothetical protein